MNKVKTLFVGTVLSAMVLFLLYWIMRWERPATSDDFADLRVERKILPVEKNFRIVLVEAVNGLPQGISWYEWWSVGRSAIQGKWDADAVAKILGQSVEARTCVNVGLATCVGYDSGTGEKTDLLGDMPNHRALINAFRLAFEEALYKGDAVAEYGQLCEVLQGSALLLNAPDDNRDLILLRMWFDILLSECEEQLHQPDCRDEWLAELEHRLPRQEVVTQAGLRALKGEFWRSLGGLEDGTLMTEVFNPGPILEWPRRAVRLMNMKNFQLRPTCILLAEAHRRSIAEVQSGCVTNDYFGKPVFGSPLGWKDIFCPNFGGRCVVECQSLRLRHIVDSIKGMENGVACIRVLLASERYRRKYGRLPETLEVLVPEFMSEIPCDTFGNGQLKYSREREILWSVGQNMRDDGGSIRVKHGLDGHYRTSNFRRALDMVYPVSSNRYAEEQWAVRQRETGRQR